MTKDEIAKSIDPVFPSVYAPTIQPTKLTFKDGSSKVGYFDFTNNWYQQLIVNIYYKFKKWRGNWV